MKPTGIIRRIDDLGRVVIPKDVRRICKIKEGDPLEIFTEHDGSIVIKPYRKSWEDTVLEWWDKNQNRPAMRCSDFTRKGDYTFCVVNRPYSSSVAGFAKRYCNDTDDDRIGKVAAFARAVGVPINELIGWKD